MDNPLEEAVHLGGLVDYQPDSVVSRVVFRNPGGTMTLFAFSEGQGLSEHTNPNDAVITILEGAARVVIDGSEHALSAGQVLHLPPTIPHELVPGGEFKMLLTLLKQS